MKNLELEVRIPQKLLTINHFNLNLDSSLKNAEKISSISNNPNERALELKYETNKSTLHEEAEKIYNFLRKINCSDKIDLNFCPNPKEDLPTVALIGEYQLKIYN